MTLWKQTFDDNYINPLTRVSIMEEAGKKKWASVVLVVGAISFIIALIYFTVISSINM